VNYVQRINETTKFVDGLHLIIYGDYISFNYYSNCKLNGPQRTFGSADNGYVEEEYYENGT